MKAAFTFHEGTGLLNRRNDIDGLRHHFNGYGKGSGLFAINIQEDPLVGMGLYFSGPIRFDFIEIQVRALVEFQKMS